MRIINNQRLSEILNKDLPKSGINNLSIADAVFGDFLTSSLYKDFQEVSRNRGHQACPAFEGEGLLCSGCGRWQPVAGLTLLATKQSLNGLQTSS